jgi:hypothetical protein
MNGVDLDSVFETTTADRAFNMIDAIIASDILSGAMLEEGGIERVRAKINAVYNPSSSNYGSSNDDDSGYYTPGDTGPTKTDPIVFTKQLDDGGFEGLIEEPLG